MLAVPQLARTYGHFSDAIAAYQADPAKNAAACTSFNYGSTNSTAPDRVLGCGIRRQKTALAGFVQQYVAKDQIGVSAAAMYGSDGKSEVDALHLHRQILQLVGVRCEGHTLEPASRDVNRRLCLQCRLDLPDSHAKYLGMGGIDGFVGDGKMTGPRRSSRFHPDALLQLQRWEGLVSFRLRLPAHHQSRPQRRPRPGKTNVKQFQSSRRGSNCDCAAS